MTDAAKPPRERPLSPHMQIWRWHITMASSILHRATGVALYVGALILAGWALALASGPVGYDTYLQLLGSPLGKLVLFGLTVSIFFHLANGVRHLFWDFGEGLDPKTANMTAAAAMTFAIVISAFVWVAAAFTGVLGMSRYRTDLARARGLGAAKHGAGHWLNERITSILLAPLSIWAVFAGFRLAAADYATAVIWLQSPFNAVMLILLVVISFIHMHAGMRVIVEDYIHTNLSKSALLILNLMVCLLFGALAVVSILKVALGGGIF